MSIKEQLLQEIESSSERLLEETLEFLKLLKGKQQNQKLDSTGRKLYEHLKTIGTWSGDDLEECNEAVESTRGEARFNLENPFEEE